jgi:membrane protein implicated in regulation of membrane protease activity
MFHLLWPQSKPIDSSIVLFDEPKAGRVEEAISPSQSGRVRADATYWEAELYDVTAKVVLPIGSRVRVLGRRGLVLLVIPAN